MIRRKKYIKYTLAELKRYIADEGTCVHKIHAKQHIGLSLSGVADLKEAIDAELDHKIGRMDQQLNGIVLDIRNIKVYNEPVFIHADYSDLHLNFEANFYVFQPRIGAIVQGVVRHIGKQYLGVLIYRVFNVAVLLGRTQQRDRIRNNQKIKLRIVNFDLTSSLPEIEGQLVLSNQAEEHDVDSGIGAEESKAGVVRVKQERRTDEQPGTTDSDEEDVPPTPKSILKNKKKDVKKKDSKSKPKSNKRVSFLDNAADLLENVKQEPVSSDQDVPPPTFDDFERSVDFFSTQLPLNVSIKDEPPSSSQEQTFNGDAVRAKNYKKHKDSEEKTRKRKASETLDEPVEEILNDTFKEPPRKKKKKRDRADVEEVIEPVKVKQERSPTPDVAVKKIKKEKEPSVESSVETHGKKKKKNRDKESSSSEVEPIKSVKVKQEPTLSDANVEESSAKKKKKKKQRKDSEELDASIANIFDEVESAVAEIRNVKREPKNIG